MKSIKVASSVLAVALAWGAAMACKSDSQASPAVERAPEVATVAASPGATPLNQVSTDSFSLSWSTVGPVEVGQPAKGQLVLTAKAPFKCNLEYPFKLKLTAGDLEPVSAEVTKADMQVAKDQVVVPVTFTARKAGDATMQATFALSVCTDEKCLIERETLRLSANATAK